jgi:hypothetical protein
MGDAPVTASAAPAGAECLRQPAVMRFPDDPPDAFRPGDDEPDDDLLAELDRDFPLGDGTADVDATVFCPWCAAPVSIALDPGSGSSQDYVEDCEVCCRPWRVSVRYDASGAADVSVEALGA